MNERENSTNPVVAVLENKLDQLISAVQEIKDQMHDNSVDIANLKLEVNTFKNKTEQQQKEIDKLYSKNDANKNWIMGLVASVGATIIIAVLKIVFGAM